MFSFIPNQLSLALRTPRVLIAAGVGVVAAAGFAGYVFTRPKPTAEEAERDRRDLLASIGRITDGTIMDTLTTGADSIEPATLLSDDGSVPVPHIIVYNYRIAGVTYECAQDVTTLAEHVRGVRSDLPIQVRYEPHNPGNSIIVAESWSGLRLISSNPFHPDPHSSQTS